MPIKNIPLNMQPRERALMNGINSLTDVELLALFLRTGHKNISVIELANILIKNFNDLNQLSKTTLKEMKKIKGIGNAKSIEILGLFEMAKRINNKKIKIIQNYSEAINIARQLLPNYNQEHFVIIVLSIKNEIIYRSKIASGKEDSISLSPKIILGEILKRDGFSFYCFHNHPSENSNPSNEDILMTENLSYYCDLLGIKLIGHYIITKKSHKKIEINYKV